MLRLTETKHEVMRIGVMAAQQTLTLLVEALRSGRRGRVFESRHSDFTPILWGFFIF